MFHGITIIGFVGQPLQMRYTEDRTPVTTYFSAATHQGVSKDRVAGCPTPRMSTWTKANRPLWKVSCAATLWTAARTRASGRGRMASTGPATSSGPARSSS
jgi:hypothetical protein